MINDKIIVAAADGDRQAFSKIYEEFNDMVWGLALKFTENTQVAEDGAAEIFVKLYKKIDKFDFRSSFKTWLYRFSVNTLLNFLEKEKRRYTARISDEMAEEGSPQAAQKKTDDKVLVRTLLSRIKPGEREIMILREIEGRSYKEIAEITGMKLGTVKTNIYRARESLRKVYKEETA
ncbi:MAG: sigma-70 family RNA polymerase sigma factor [Elusimicrobia bacterium]|jgi:RNA polymerase sigma-70 factor (ECF subfamily)|nr:sigma-70 family RNA polymerase sigma factor [Elusimicrobiota bacterium]